MSFNNIYQKNKNVINKVCFIIGLLLIVSISIKYLFGIISPFILGYILSILLDPLCSLFSNKFKIHRGLSSFFSIIFALVFIGIIGTNLVLTVIDQGEGYVQNLPIYFEEISFSFEEIKKNFDDLILIPDEFHGMISNIIDSITPSITSSLSSMVGSGSKGIMLSIPNAVSNLVFGFISCFFFLKDKELIKNSIAVFVPNFIKEKYDLIYDSMIKALFGYVKAQLILMTFTATIAIIGLLLIGYQFALFIGFIISIIDAFPVFGSGFILWPWAFINLVTGDYTTALYLMIIYVTILLTRQILEPKILGNQIGLHPLVTLMSIYVGIQIYGVVGILLGPCLIIIIKAIWCDFENPTS